MSAATTAPSAGKKHGRLRRTAERVRNEPGLGRNVIVLTVLIVLALTSGGVILAHQRVNWPWDSHYTLYASFEDAPGVSADHGQEVRVAGIKIGEIASSSVGKDGHAKLELDLDDNTKVYSNATVVLRPKSPLNEMYVELNPGAPPAKLLKSGSSLSIGHSQRPIEIDEVLGHLDANTRQALTDLLSQSDVATANASTYLPGDLSSLDAMSKTMKPVVTALDTRRATLAKLVTALSQISTAVGGDDTRLTRVADSLQKTLDAVGGKSSALNSSISQLPDLTQQLEDATGAVQTLGTQLNPTLDDLTKASASLPSALSRVTKTVDQAGHTVDQLKPVLANAQPVVLDLRPLIGSAVTALPDLRATVGNLDPLTSNLVRYLPDLGAFILNSRSFTSLQDANGGILRGLLEITPSSLPGGVLPATLAKSGSK